MKQHLFITDVSQIDELKHHDAFTAICQKCGAEYTITDFRLEPDRLVRYRVLLCQPCYAKKMKEEKYGNPNYNNRKQAAETKLTIYGDATFNNREKFKQTCMEIYGADNPNKSEIVKEKIKNTSMARYGTTCTLTNKEINDKVRKTMNERYGVSYAMLNDELKQKQHDSSVKNNNGLYHTQTDNFKQMMREMNLCHPEWAEKSVESNRKNHNGLLYTQTNHFKEYMSKQNSLHPEWQDDAQSKRIYYDYQSFDSTPEFCVYIFCFYNGIPIVRNCKGFPYKDIKGKDRHVHPDFIIAGQYVEVKGAHFFKPDGTMWLPYREPEWDDERYEYESSIYESKRQCLIRNGVIIIKDTDPWVQMCVNWVKTFFGNYFIWQFTKNTFENVSYGYNPYNCDQTKEFQDPIGLGKTPFNCDQNKDYQEPIGLGEIPFDIVMKDEPPSTLSK